MAKKSFIQKIKDFFTGGGSSSGGSSGGSGKRSSGSYYGGGYSSSYRSYGRSSREDEKEKQRQKIKEQNKQTTAKLAAIAKVSQRTDALSSGKKSLPPEPKALANNGVERAIKKIGEKSNAAPDPKREAAKASRERAKQTLENIKKDREELNAETNNRYNTKQSNKEEAQLARQRIKSGEMAADPTVARVEFEQHPVASLAGRKFAQGMSFGLADLAEQKLAGDRYKESIDLYKKAEEEHPWVAGLSELAGGLVGFGGTAGATERLGAKAVSKVAPRAAERLAEKKVVQSLAKRGVNKAVKKGLVSEATEELIKQTGKEKAAKIVSALGNDIVQNLTTGAVYDLAVASKDNEVGSPEWWKSLGTSAALNFGITGVIAGGSVLGGNKKAAVRAAESLAKENGISVDAARKLLRNNLTVKGKAKPLIRNADEAVENVAKNADETVENVARNVDEAMTEPPKLNEVETAPPKLEDVETAPPELEEIRIKSKPKAKAEPKSAEARLAEVDAELDEIHRRINDPSTSTAEKEALDKQSRPLYKEKNKLEADMREAKATEKKAKAAEKKAQKTKKIDTAENADRDIHEVLRDKNVPLAEKEAALDARVEELDKALENAGNRMNDTRLAPEVREAAQKEYDDIAAEIKQLSDEFNGAKSSSEFDALMQERRNLRKTLDEMPFVEENYEERQAIMQRLEELDRQLPSETTLAEDIADELAFANAGDMTPEQMTGVVENEWKNGRPSIDTPRSGKQAQNDVNKEIQKAAENAGYKEDWTSGKDYEGYSVREADEIWGTEKVDGEVRTKRGGYTLATGMGDVKFAGDMKDAIASGDFDRNVRHNKEEYTKAVKRLVGYLDGKGGKDGNENIIDLINRFENFAKSNKPLTSNEMRDQLYDILAAVDLANGNKDKEWASKLFMAATRAGAEQSSVGGLTLYQWHRIAMSSPEHRAKVVKEQIENMFNSSRKFRKKYLGSVKKKLGDKFSAVGDDLPLDKFMEENPEVSKGMKAAYERLEKATSKEEVETATSEFLLEARKVMPVTAFDQLTQWRYVAMLSSPKTHIKNVVGNLYSGTLGQMSVAMSSSMENRLAKELNLTTTKNVDLSKGIAADQDLYLKSASGISNKARTNAKKGVFAGIELRNAKSKLKEAERKLATAEKGADTTELKQKVKELTEKVAEAQKNFDAKKIDPNKDLLGAKAQDLYHTKSVEQLIQDATKWEKQTYGAVSGGLEKASNFIGGALETSDAVAVERIYRETAEKILKANDYEHFVKLAAGDGNEAAAAKVICNRIEEYAAEHAAYRAALDTYRNYNAVATWLNKTVKNTVYNADANFIKKAAGFGLHAVMPFTKVPTNILKRSIDYSPFGLIEGKKMLNAAIESGDYAAINKAVERLAEGKIGTGIAALGMGLAMLDPDGMYITTRLNRKDERDKAKKDRGYMDYSVRPIKPIASIKNGEITPGNRDYTLEWATPTASTFFTGVEFGRMLNRIYNNFADGNGLDFDPSKALEASGEMLTRLVEPTLQLGMFQGVNGVLEDSMESRYDEANINPIFKAVGTITKNYVSSMTPSLVRGLSKAFAKSDYYISGKNDLDYRKNLLISKIPGLSAAKLDAKTNAWGEIKNERSEPGERVLRGAETLLAPWNSSEVTWDETDTKLYDFAEEYKKTHPKAQTLDFLPKVFYDYNNEGLTFGKNDATSKHVELSNNDAAQYNIARGKAGEDAMAAAMESVIFNRWYKDEKGKYTISDSKNYTPEMKAKKIAEFKGKGTKEVVAWVMDQPQFKNATSAEQAQIIREVIGNSGKDTSIGAKRTSELAVAKRHDISEEEYNYKNEVSANAQKALDDAIAAGIVTYEMATDFARNAGKTYYRTDQKGEEGGSVQTYYNKKEMMEYLAEKGYDYEEAEALYNAFKSANAKDFNGISTSSGSGRRGYGGYRHRSGGGGSSGKAKVPAPKKIAKGSLKSGQALVSKKKSSSSRSNDKTTLARVEAKIDLPTAKYSKQKRG